MAYDYTVKTDPYMRTALAHPSKLRYNKRVDPLLGSRRIVFSLDSEVATEGWGFFLAYQSKYVTNSVISIQVTAIRSVQGH